MTEFAPIVQYSIWFVFGAVGVGLLLAFYRLLKGPSLPDRVLATEYISILCVSLTALYSIASRRPVFLEAAIALALISFLATVAFARYVEKGEEVHE